VSPHSSVQSVVQLLRETGEKKYLRKNQTKCQGPRVYQVTWSPRPEPELKKENQERRCPSYKAPGGLDLSPSWRLRILRYLRAERGSASAL
jgi:hypothetical protein